MKNIMDELRGKLTVTAADRHDLPTEDMAALERLIARVDGPGFVGTSHFNDQYYSADELLPLRRDYVDDAVDTDPLKDYLGKPQPDAESLQDDPERVVRLARKCLVIRGMLNMPTYEGYCFCMAGVNPALGKVPTALIPRLYTPASQWFEGDILNASLRAPVAEATDKSVIVVIEARYAGRPVAPIAPNDVLFLPKAEFRAVKLVEYTTGKFMLFLREIKTTLTEADLLEQPTRAPVLVASASDAPSAGRREGAFRRWFRWLWSVEA